MNSQIRPPRDMDAVHERIIRAAERSEQLPEVNLQEISRIASKAYSDAVEAGEDIEQAEGNKRKAVEKQNLFQAPIGERRNPPKKNENEAERKNRCGHGSGGGNKEIAAVADAHFGVLGEVS